MASILAHHWREGGNADRSREYLLTAADRARQALAVEETYDLYSQALDLTSEDTDRLKIRLLRAQALVQLQDFTRAAHELAELIPLLDGETQVEALVARSHATLWTEQTEETMACAQRALDLARTGGFAELETAALGMVAAAHGMCGEAGDLEKAVTLGDEALANWPSHSRESEHAELYHLAANHCYWYGDYERAMSASESSFTTAGVELHSQEFRLHGAGMRGIILASLGRYEEAIAAAEYAIELGRVMGRPVSVVMNYSTLPLREIFAVDEALARSEGVADLLGPSDFNMPWMNARADVFVARVMKGDLSTAEGGWNAIWSDAVGSKAWERWRSAVGSRRPAPSWTSPRDGSKRPKHGPCGRSTWRSLRAGRNTRRSVASLSVERSWQGGWVTRPLANSVGPWPAQRRSARPSFVGRRWRH